MTARSPERLHVALGLLAGVTGGPATYGLRLLAGLAEEDLDVTVVSDRIPEGLPDRFDAVEVPMRGGIDRLRWQYVALPRALRRLRPDVYHDTKNALPRGLSCPGVVTVHDLAYHRVPETFGWMSRLFLKRATRDAVIRSRRIVVPSQATADDLTAIHPESARKTRVVLHGIDPAPAVTDVELQNALNRFGLQPGYVLHVGTIQSRKNVDLVVRAVRELRASHPHLRCVVVGRRGWLAERAMEEIERDDTAVWLGSVPGEALGALYRGAGAFVSPSAYEGFGFTVADALAAGVPTVVSDVSSLPEVGGDAVLKLGAIDVPAIVGALDRILTDRSLAARLAAAGPERATSFDWRRAARETAQVYREAVEV